MSRMRDLDAFAGAYGREFPYHDENLAMLSWYADRLCRTVLARGARSLLSLGIGHRVVSQAVLERLVPGLDEYTIVEGSPARIAELRAAVALPAAVRLVEAYFEHYQRTQPVDVVEMGFVLEHVDDPELVVRRFAGFLRPGGLMVVVVPNARALHRRFGQAAGLLDDLYRLSPADLQLGHQRYFDLESVRRLLEAAGLRVTRTEGIFLKCLTTAQLSRLALPPEVVRAFYGVGADLPDLCNALYLETVT